MHQIGSAPRPKAPVTTPVELQGRVRCLPRNIRVHEPGNPSGRTRQKPANLVRGPDTAG